MNEDLLLYIIGRLGEEEADSLTLRLVKLLYLTDVEYYRSYGQTITGLDWISYRYGPYAMALPDIYSRLELEIDYEEIVTQAGYRARKFSLKAPLQEVQDRLPFRLRVIVDRLIKVLGLEDINAILDYVYFHTEPMIDAKWKKPLDFSKITQRSIQRPIWISLPKKEASNLRDNLAKILDELDEDEISFRSYYDESYYKTIALMDSEDTLPQLNGKKLKINPDTLRLLHQYED